MKHTTTDNSMRCRICGGSLDGASPFERERGVHDDCLEKRSGGSGGQRMEK